MKKRLLSTLVVLCVSAVFAGCSSPAQDTAFQPPAGWKSTPGLFGRMQMWMNGSTENDRQILMIVRGGEGTNSSNFTRATSGMHDVKRDTIVLCGSQRAEHFTGKGEGGNGARRVPQQIEGMVTTIGGSKYFALYIRPVSMRPDEQAETALHSLCPKTS